MAYNYLGLVNQINRRLNEVELTSSNFSTATGFYGQAKDAARAVASLLVMSLTEAAIQVSVLVVCVCVARRFGESRTRSK